jgi:hypothetical protein
MPVNCNTPRPICTPEHPGYIGNLPPDPSDVQIVGLISNVPYIGGAAALALGPLMLTGGPVCVEDNRRNFTSNWRKEIIAGILFFGVLAVLIIVKLRK